MQPVAILLAAVQYWVSMVRDWLPLITAGLVVFLLFFVLAKVARWLIRGALRRQDRVLAQMVSTLLYIVMLIFGVMAALWVALPTFNFADIFASLGLTGLVLGFALRDIIENFVAGLLILWRRPFRVGDQIVSGAYEGTVVEINFRSTVLKTYDGIKVYIPNGKVFTEPMENKTGYPERRSRVVLALDQDASISKAREVILRTLEETESVLPSPAPEVFLEEIGDFSNNFHVLYWIRPPTRAYELATRSIVTERLYQALRAAGIGFPYPIHTVQLEQLKADRGTRKDRQLDESAPTRPAGASR